MKSDLSAQSLAERLKAKMQDDRQQIENLIKNELEQLTSNLKRQSSAALSSTKSDIESEIKVMLSDIKKQIEIQTKPMVESLASVSKEAKTLQAVTFRSWFKSLAVTLSLLIGICAASWASILWLSSNIRGQLATRSDLAQQIEEQQKTLARQVEEQQETLTKIEAKTWGVVFNQNEKGRFLIFPLGVEPLTGFQLGERSVVKLGEK